MKAALRAYEKGLRAESKGRWIEAAKHYATGIRLAPQFVEAVNNYGWCMLKMGRFEDAVSALRSANRLRPDDPVILANLGEALRAKGDVPAALDTLRRLNRLRPGVEADRALASSFWALGRPDEALEAAERVIASPSASLSDRSLVLHLRRALAIWDRLEEFSDEAIAGALAADAGYAGSPFRYFAQVEDPMILREIATRAARRASTEGGQATTPINVVRSAGAQIRIGFISQDFRDHPMMKLIAGLFRHLDQGRFRLYIYALGPGSGDDRREALRHRAAVFRELGGTAVSIATAIRDDRLDALIDLMGFTRGARPDVMALRPARRQIAWLGLPGTSGAPFIDDVIVDEFVAPSGAESAFSESVRRIAPTYYPFDNSTRRPRIRPSRASLDIPEDAFVFASFNQTFKLDPLRFGTWLRLLDASPGSHLLLLDTPESARERLRTVAKSAGVSPARIRFMPWAGHEDHLDRIPLADLALDTWLYGGHTTTIDALWCGVPVVTRSGRTFSSRVAGSILAAAGLPDLITNTEDEYFEVARRFSADPAFAARQRERVMALSADEPPFGTEAFARSFGDLIEQLACS